MNFIETIWLEFNSAMSGSGAFFWYAILIVQYAVARIPVVLALSFLPATVQHALRHAFLAPHILVHNSSYLITSNGE